MNKVHLLTIAVGILLTFAFEACKKDNDPVPPAPGDNRVFIVNEGPFQAGSGTIDFFYRDTKVIDNRVFEVVNGRPLGNLVQSVAVHGDKAYIMVNNANKIEVVDAVTFKSLATIDSITLPRYFLGIDHDKGYVTCWDNTVKVIDLDDFHVKRSIDLPGGPERLIQQGDFVYVLNIGGFGNDSTMSVINTASDQLVETIEVGGRPSGIVADSDGHLWILCAGIGWNGWPGEDDTKGRLVRYNTATMSLDREMEFPSTELHPDDLAIDKSGTVLYYTYINGIYEFPIDAGELPVEPIIIRNNMFYGLGYDDSEQLIYASDPVDFIQNGWVFRYTETGAVVDSFMVGILPGDFCFN